MYFWSASQNPFGWKLSHTQVFMKDVKHVLTKCAMFLPYVLVQLVDLLQSEYDEASMEWSQKLKF